MARESTHIEAPPETAWAALADGWRYSDWVVGSKRVRDVDAGWPAAGTRIHHTVGLGPLARRDDTESLRRLRRVVRGEAGRRAGTVAHTHAPAGTQAPPGSGPRAPA